MMDFPQFEDADLAAGEVVAMQFAGGVPIAQLVDDWERDSAWVEAAIRRALLASIPRRDGGLKVSRSDVRLMRKRAGMAVSAAQAQLEFVA